MSLSCGLKPIGTISPVNKIYSCPRMTHPPFLFKPFSPKDFSLGSYLGSSRGAKTSGPGPAANLFRPLFYSLSPFEHDREQLLAVRIRTPRVSAKPEHSSLKSKP